MKKLFITFSLLVLIKPSFAGPGHDHGDSAFASGTAPTSNFELSEQQMKNLGIKSEKADFLPITNTVEMLAFTELLPEKRVVISPRFGGKILKISVKVGQKVKRGDRLVTLEPVNVGNNNVTLFAPIDGFVLNLHANAGEIVDAGGNILEVGDASQMLIRGVAYETPDIAKIKVDQNVNVHLDITPEHHIQGKVQRINRVIDPESRTFSVFALVHTPEHDIQAGLQGTMEILTGNDIPVLAVPKRAVLGELGSYFVYVIKDNQVEKRDVTLGIKTAHHLEIKSGIFPFEHVVTNGNYQLQYISVGGIKDHAHDDDSSHAHAGHSHDEKHDDSGHEHEQVDHKHDHDHGNHKH